MKKTLRVLILLIFMSFMTNVCQSQKLNKIYYGISNDSLIINHLIEFKNDSILELSSTPRHRSKQFKMTFNYTKKNGVLNIYNSDLKPADSIQILNLGFGNFIQTINLKIEDKVLLDQKNESIYIIYNDFKKKHYITYIINGKKYKQDSGLTNSYGIIEKYPKRNKKLIRELKVINPDLKDYETTVFKSFDAYNKFGYEYVFGVIEMNLLK